MFKREIGEKREGNWGWKSATLNCDKKLGWHDTVSENAIDASNMLDNFGAIIFL